MGVDAWTITGSAASVVAAVGVVWERWHWVKTRPRPDVRVRVRGRNIMAGVGSSNGEYQGLVKNWGTEDALSVQIHGWHCDTHIRPQAEKTVLAPQETVRFTLDVAPEDIDRAWISVFWNRPASATHGHGAWFPVNDEGALAEVLASQIDGPWARRKIVTGLTRARIPSPLTIASGKMQMGMPISSKQAAARYSTKPPAKWRRWLGIKLQVPPTQIALDATADLEAPYE